MIDRNVSQRRQQRARSVLARCTRPRILIRARGFVPGRASSALAEQMHRCGGAWWHGHDKLQCGRGTSACWFLLPLQILPQSQATLCQSPGNTPRERRGSQGTGRGKVAGRGPPLCICLCRLLIKASLLERFGDSNSEISSPSVSFPHCSERIIPPRQILSHYLLPAAPAASSHPHTRRRRSNVPSVRAHLRQQRDTSLIF